MWVSLSLGNKKIALGVLYIPPNSEIGGLFECGEDTFSDVSNPLNLVYCLGGVYINLFEVFCC